MKYFWRFAVCVVLALCTATAYAQKRPFTVVQTMRYKGGVDLSADGVRYNPIIYEIALVPNLASDEPASPEALKRVLAPIVHGPLPTVLDIERWTIDTPDPERRQANIEKLVDVLKRVRKARPDMQFGYYGEVPVRIYWRMVDSAHPKQRAAWQERNDQGLRGLIPHVDAIFPSLYSFDDDAQRWEFNAREILTEARKFGKPMYCYLWPQFHSNNKALAGQYVPRELWRLELETCRELADGIVIWDHAPNVEWNPQAPWWQETMAFLHAHGLARR
ncbi:hypothetical protein ACSFBX_34555 [Variovorax sp. RB2P76]|uniref:hypothetical protein n=1 Tax=Variovorax sp. RB2P76 TaxID=3443736 RepID=UPI003F471863